MSILAALGASLHTSVLAEHRLTTECYEPGQAQSPGAQLPHCSLQMIHCCVHKEFLDTLHSFQIHNPIVQTTFVYLFVREGLKIEGDTSCCFYKYRVIKFDILYSFQYSFNASIWTLIV